MLLLLLEFKITGYILNITGLELKQSD